MRNFLRSILKREVKVPPEQKLIKVLEERVAGLDDLLWQRATTIKDFHQRARHACYEMDKLKATLRTSYKEVATLEGRLKDVTNTLKVKEIEIKTLQWWN
jgi:hypothetical protein